ncbi:MAG: Omp28-related outer membrane protein [Bacteroidetes bacterium]|nr:MAG: Omp28-related outer membrane protein [Bacteroidota bacterium]
MKIIYHLLSLITLFILLACCDEITGDYRQSQNQNIDTSKNARRILLEDYTGFKCGSCPAAAEIAHDIESRYSGRVILMTVHAGYFAEPTTAHPYDFRTPEGNEWNVTFGIRDIGNPNGMVNRIKSDGSYVITPTKWDAVVLSLLNTEPVLKLEFNAYYSLSRKEISVDAMLTYLKDGFPTHNFVACILEDSIVQYQIDYRKTPQDIEDYVHNHVFRATMNSTWGEPVSVNDIKAGAVIRKNCKYIIPESKGWRIDKLKIVCFVHDNSTKEILQSGETDKLILIP